MEAGQRWGWERCLNTGTLSFTSAEFSASSQAGFLKASQVNFSFRRTIGLCGERRRGNTNPDRKKFIQIYVLPTQAVNKIQWWEMEFSFSIWFSWALYFEMHITSQVDRLLTGIHLGYLQAPASTHLFSGWKLSSIINSIFYHYKNS